jgi:hypothetical protein
VSQNIANLQFDGVDNRDLIDVLIEVINIASNDGEIPSVEVVGKRYSPVELSKLAKLLPYDEEMLPHHQAMADKVFHKPQRGYGRTAINLARRATQIASEIKRRRLDRA